MAGHGGASTEESVYGEETTGKGVVRISAVAALAGFLFDMTAPSSTALYRRCRRNSTLARRPLVSQ